ncbi:methionyl-tRNA formyltransferase [Mycobacteroides chelonae]|uniref:methionyl-tRNA formyltransferase n=1 Tax=Mycobacteroides chelonae TaxID=1774 RepID=UPI0004AACC5F|nr:methionyl-tRNA formyltransferase [Mycobacteroides chelonae]MBF9315383.1 methionyl-tRNA formyltransferase [Mycobacteroides chelonae]OHT73942.1 methionyl-tRNA formyltransferase [Mycobacteroides chelonae]OHT76498.1 methionyl-tRNA formyltransferase [Mycobacteroides chelonae]OHU50591.1 methionyl-tRNA formyltransferase [Mycobacteroides chelonae]
MRIVFAGTPAPALPSLRRLLASRHEVVAVLTRPDARAGRGRAAAASPVAELAREHGLPVLTPARPNDAEFVSELTELAPDCCAVVAYGALLKPELLAVPTHGWVNLHFSLLPAWRGAAPVQASIAAGDQITGATTFLIEPALDSGPVYGVVTERITAGDTAGALLGRLAESGAGLLESTMDGIEDGALVAVPQPADGVSVAPKITVEQARIRWELPAHAIDRHIRAMTPEPGAWTTIGDIRIKVGPVRTDVDVPAEELPPGAFAVRKRDVLVGTGTTPIALDAVQPQGKKLMNAVDWARGARLDAEVRAL